MNKLFIFLLFIFPLFCSQKNIMPKQTRSKPKKEVRDLGDLIRNLESRIVRFANNQIIIVRGSEDFIKCLKDVEDLYLKIAERCPKNFGEQLVLMRKLVEQKLTEENKPNRFCILM